jgi:hypothetical protein
MTGFMSVAGFDATINWLDPHNVFVPAAIPPSAYAGFANILSPTVTLTSFPVTYGINCGGCSFNQSADSVQFGSSTVFYAQVPQSTGEVAARDLVFTTTIAGYFNNLQIIQDSFVNGGISQNVSNNGMKLETSLAG